MIFANGRLYDTSEQGWLLAQMEERICQTLAGPPLTAETVIAALDTLGQSIAAGRYDAQIALLALDGLTERIGEAVGLLSREALAFQLQTELGELRAPYATTPPNGQRSIEVRPMPLGVLFHIAAGNLDGLPIYSLAQGLLTGNINLLKLPQADSGLSLRLAQELVQIEPALAPFVYLFDTPSEDVETMQRLAALADGIVTWGGDAAVSAVRRMAKPGTRLIEWGHKLSFCYLSGLAKKAQLTALAEHLFETKQLLCSSCQVIYLDTDSLEELDDFCICFLPLLNEVAKRYPSERGTTAETTLLAYTNWLERSFGHDDGQRFYRGAGCSLTRCADSELALSRMMGNVLVKRLPRTRLIETLRRSRGYLQTAGLICPEHDRNALTDLLLRGGVTKVSGPGEMSNAFCGEAHDGAYPLRQYLRVANVIRPAL